MDGNYPDKQAVGGRARGRSRGRVRDVPVSNAPGAQYPSPSQSTMMSQYSPAVRAAAAPRMSAPGRPGNASPAPTVASSSSQYSPAVRAAAAPRMSAPGRPGNASPAPTVASSFHSSSTLSSKDMPALSASVDRMAIGDGVHRQRMAAGPPKPAVRQQFSGAPPPVKSGSGDPGARPAPGRRRRDEYTMVETRPLHIQDKTGTSGTPIKLVTNYFRLVSMPQFCVHQYHLEFMPSVESSRMRRDLVLQNAALFDKTLVFDGMSDLKTPKRLPDDITEAYGKRLTDGSIICIRIKWVQELSPINPDLLRLFNTQMRRNLERLDFVQINRHYFDKHAVSTIPQHGLELWQGLITAIGQHETGIMMVTDTLHKVLRRDSVLDLMGMVPQSVNYKDEVVRRVAGCIVMTPYNNKTYRVDDVDWDKNPLSTFETKDGPRTFLEYYTAQYGKSIRDVRQPLLVCRPKEKDLRAGRVQSIYLVPELCVLTGLTDEMRSNVSVMRDLAQHTRVDPAKRVRNLLEFIARINGTPVIREEMERWAISFDNELVGINARVLPCEKVTLGTYSCRYNAITADFSRETRDRRLHVSVALEAWMVICHRRDQPHVTEFVRTLMSVCPPMGVEINQPQLLLLDDDRAGSYVRSLHELGAGRNFQMALVVVPNNRKDRYDTIKKEACVDLGLHTQVILARTIGNKKNLRSVATKVAVQLNCKLGGEAWCLEVPLVNTMVIGYDTYKDSGSSKKRSAGAFVASMNKGLTRWYSRVAFHDTHQELGNSLAKMLEDALRKYSQANDGASPDRIIFFRDGVSDGQIPQVKEWEIDQIVIALQALFPGVELKLAFIVVTKRISTRFFVTGSEVKNPPPGTVVDSEVTRPERYDFFLVSQSVRQGTVAPTHYNIIHDTTGLKPDHMQRLAYKLTHLYFNWPGTIRVPAPCQYAHKLAFLAGQSLHGEHHKNLSSTLFYL